MGRAMSTSMFRQAASRARDAGLDDAPSKKFCARLANAAVHCVSNHICIGGYVRFEAIFMLDGMPDDAPGEAYQTELLTGDFNSFPSQEDVLKAFQKAESNSMTPGQIEGMLEGLSPLQRRRLCQGDWHRSDTEGDDV